MAPAKKNTETAGLPASITATGVAPAPALTEEQQRQAAINARLQELQLMKLEEELAKKREDDEMKKRAREQGARTMQRQRDAELARQEGCSHRKPNGQPAIGGQRDHQHNYRFICLFCSKEWTNNELPRDLIIDRDKIGGPDS